MKKIISILLILTIVIGTLAGCGNNSKLDGSEPGNNSVLEGTTNNGGENSGTAPVDVDFTQADGDMFTERDNKAEYDTSKAVTIELNGTSAAASSDSVQINGSTVIIKEEATYVISGSLNGMLVVDAPDTAKLQLVLNGVDITSETSAALYILEADKVFVTLADGTTNTLANGGSFIAVDDNNIDGALFSKQDLTLNGSGSLTVTSTAGHGIVCKDDLVITGGTYVVNSASHGLDANDSVRIINAALTIDAGKDAIHCENSDDATKGLPNLFRSIVSKAKEFLQNLIRQTALPPKPVLNMDMAEFHTMQKLMIRVQDRAKEIRSLQEEVPKLKAQLAETKGIFKGKERKALETQIQQRKEKISAMLEAIPDILKDDGYPDVQAFMATYRKAEAVVDNYNRELAEWERKVKEKSRPAEKERYAPPEKQSVRDQLRRLQAEGRQPKHKHRSHDRER